MSVGSVSEDNIGVSNPNVRMARSAWMKPAPEMLSKPGVAISIAVDCRIDFISDGDIPVPLNFWLPEINRAATPPACGAAAEVPKKLGKFGDSPTSRFKVEPRSTVV